MIETQHMPTSERTSQLQQWGLETDGSGRPLHPWLTQYGTDLPEASPLWQWGPNAAADAIILNSNKPEVVLIQRADGTWANAGGFIDANDGSPAHAAAREANEETGLSLDPAEAMPVFEGIVNDSRAGKYQWVTTAAFLWRTAISLDMLTAGDDARDIQLVDLADVRERELYGSHGALIKQAVDRYGTPAERERLYASNSL